MQEGGEARRGRASEQERRFSIREAEGEKKQEGEGNSDSKKKKKRNVL